MIILAFDFGSESSASVWSTPVSDSRRGLEKGDCTVSSSTDAASARP